MRVAVDCFFDQLEDYPAGATMVAVDVIRAATTAVTAVAGGRRCFVVPDLDDAARQAQSLPNPFLVGELGGNMPFGFDGTNSPVAVSQLGDPERPLVLLSTSGTRLMTSIAQATDAAYVACLRNWRAQAAAILRDAPEEVVLLGAGTRGEFREEDQVCCAWVAGELIAAGADANAQTLDLVARWEGMPVSEIAKGRSAAYLRGSGQLHDLEFVLTHVDDIHRAYVVRGNEILEESAPSTAPSGGG